MKNKKFTFATFSMLCITVTTIALNYTADAYIKLVGAVVGLFMIAQGVVDTKKKGDSNGI